VTFVCTFLANDPRAWTDSLADIGNARIAGMEEDLKLSSNQFEWLIWAFYITYIGFEWMTLMSVSRPSIER
jgi:hypothetical protein